MSTTDFSPSEDAQPHACTGQHNSADSYSPATNRDEVGALPYGRPLQTEFDDGLDYPRMGGVSFRRGTLTPNQTAIWDEHWPEVGTVLSDEQIDVEQWFGRPGPTIVEIGCGTGTSTVDMAPREADHNIIAVELYRPGLAKLLGAMVRADVRNIRMVRGDGVEVLQRMIAPGSLAGVRVFFPDPWPKARHHKRRIIQSGTLRLIASRLAPGGVLHVATDHAEYAEWIGELREVEPALEPMPWPWPESPMLLDRPTTKFERRGLGLDHSIHEFVWRRRKDEETTT
ncbi:tRNA (guanosine(46)-N7)-methyltransferase TrmB [Corynebacterium sp. TAE3-ERU12]|uniref:tRNA (guanosine(46)-N7)-methyltransferase TrmB n=1 Tax=Corynebacterium sp. TAE3-ERU12 TaxID=2849491 RepID=UPI001C47E1B0|nr:tRNA (guanosine(46)-N7)-methyltransferase TrmB [Corynebacterium sp. TAE3-ERU12]MBV7296056.1 tRNA (guanosine(46)-N7)-methyltransferase TrmB [Corynebacterium sp. TAE3-ERU12]